VQGADEFYDLIDKADRLKVGELKRINCYGYGYGFKYKNIVFILSTHARGKCFKIWIYENENIQDTLRDSHLEVYGVTGGNPGWTETYGWLHEGSWIKYIDNYFKHLETLIYNEEHKAEIEADIRKQNQMNNLQNKVNKFNNIFNRVMGICDHKYPDGRSAIDYCSTYEMKSWDMYCKLCKKQGSREELENENG
jgi:hypothetical protein